jgi:hypothetical protein
MPQAELCLLSSCIKLVLIDRARRDDSIGCYIVNIHFFDPNGENLGCRLDFEATDGFLTPFLTETICKKKSSIEAEYTPNR